jgi:polyhydroxybutyrate depolymerase
MRFVSCLRVAPWAAPLVAVVVAVACSSATPTSSIGGSGSSATSGSTATGTTGSDTASAGSGTMAVSGSVGSGSVAAGSGSVVAGSGTVVGSSGAGAGAGSTVGTGSGMVAGGGATTGASGATGSAGSSSGVATAPHGPSAGCNKAPVGDNSGGFTQHNITVTGVDAAFLMGGANYGTQGGFDFTHRNYFLKLPTNYDPTKAYPLVAGGGGCGATDGLSGNGGGLNVFNGNQSVAIQVGLSYVYPAGAGACFADDFPDTPDLPYFDAMLAEVESNYCVDTTRVFVAGYSSGAWEAIMLGCARGGVVRGIGTQAGGLRIHGPACDGQPSSPMLIVGTGDTENPIGPLTTPVNDSYGSAPARDEFLMQNGCVGTATAPYTGMSADSACVSYTGCPTTAPVIWCPIGGGHGSLGSADGIWPFWASLP